ncbi:type IV pilin [Aeromonas hydrophila]|nr:type IV pilin [Aeromonas hydrophila]
MPQQAGVNITNTLNGGTALPYNFTVYLRGYDNVTATLPTALSALFTAAEPKPKPGTDVLLVQGPTGAGVPVTRNNSAAQLFVQQLSSKANYCGTGKQGYSDLCEGDIVMVSDCQKARIFQITQTQVVGVAARSTSATPTTTNILRVMPSAPGAAPAARSRSASVPARY